MSKTPQAFGTHYLRSAHIDAFGALFQRNIGPFTEGLNVVYGANEAGKTTVNAFLGGVLFGWPEARGERNAYKPAGAQRAGTLTFAPRAHIIGEQDINCTREKNTDGIKPEPNPTVLADIDEETFRTIFALNSDELLGLGRGSDITSHLLTAGAGTLRSPAQALADVKERLAACFSKSAQYPNSLSNLQTEIERTKAALDKAAEEAKVFKEEARERDALIPQIAEAQAQLTQVNEEVELLVAQSSTLERLQGEAAQLDQEDEELLSREAQGARAVKADMPSAFSGAAANLSDARLRSAREELEDLSLRQVRLEEELDAAQDSYMEARAHFAALAESGIHQKQQAAQERKTRLLSALSVALPALFAIAAIFLLVLWQREGGSPLLIGAGASGIAALVFAGLAPFMVSRMGGQRTAQDSALDEATADLETSERQLALCEQKMESFHGQLETMLASLGLEAANGSVRYARALLDEMREQRNAAQLIEQQQANLASARVALDARRKRNTEERTSALAQLGFDPETPLAQIQAHLTTKVQERDALQKSWAQLSSRVAQLDAELDRAQHMQDFDKLKLEHAQLLTRMDETKAELAKLLLVRRLFEHSIAAWEGKSQPEVYAQAGALLAAMTAGSWQEVRMNENDQLVVVDAFGQTLEPQYLSLGTCQQLYLALRIALLMTAENVGRSIPILADDILVNFDAERRVGAACALQELSCVRQVIMFTCHKEVVQLMQENCESVNLVEL